MRYKTGWYRWVGAPQNQLPGTGRAVGAPCLHPLCGSALHGAERRAEAELASRSTCQACAMAGAAPKEGALFSNFPKAPSACQALHLQTASAQRDAFLIYTKDLYRLLAALCQWVFMGDGE